MSDAPRELYCGQCNMVLCPTGNCHSCNPDRLWDLCVEQAQQHERVRKKEEGYDPL